MKKSSKKQNELEELRTAYENSKQVIKHAKAALKAEKKAVKMHLRPFKLAFKQAVQIEKETKELLKLIEKSDAKQDTFSEKVEGKAKGKKVKGAQKKDKKEKKAKKTSSSVSPPKKESTKTTKSAEASSASGMVESVALSTAPEDLTRIKGVGEKVVEMLKANGISSFADMSATSEERFRQLLRDNNMAKFRNPVNWAKEAAALIGKSPAKVAATGKRGRPKGAVTSAVKDEAAEKKSARKPSVSTKAEAPKKRGRPKLVAAPTTSAATKLKVGKASPAKKSAAPNRPGRPATKKATVVGDDFTSIKGVGEKVAQMLKENGIRTFEDMAKTSYDRFKELLQKNNMSRFRDPSEWASTAAEKAKAK